MKAKKNITLFKNKLTYLSGSLFISLLLTQLGTAYAFTYSSSTTTSYAAQWGSHGSGNGLFNYPYGLAINQSTGNVYVVDDGSNNVQIFSKAGAYISTFGTYGVGGNGTFYEPAGIAINQSTGNVYVTDYDNYRVEEFNSSGGYITQWGSSGSGNGQFSGANFIAVNPSTGNVYVTDWGNNRVQEFSSSGSYITQWGSSGSGNGQFNGPSGIGINQQTGNVYVSDGINNNVQEFSTNGSYITQWGSSGSGNGQLHYPAVLTVDQVNGDIYVSDTVNNRIEVFSSSGTYLSQFGSSGSGNGQLNQPYGIDINQSNGNVYVADGDNYRVQEFTLFDNLAQETIAGTTNVSNIILPFGSNITSESLSNTSTSDGSYSYPLGLFSFTFAVPGTVPGANVPIQVTFQTNLTPSQVTARYYNPNTKTYSTTPGATITSTTVNGQAALLLSYNITDGSTLDEDGSANGVVVDPVGLGVLKTPTTSTVSAPNTGFGTPISRNYLIPGLIYGLLPLGLVAIGAFLRKFSNGKSE